MNDDHVGQYDASWSLDVFNSSDSMDELTSGSSVRSRMNSSDSIQNREFLGHNAQKQNGNLFVGAHNFCGDGVPTKTIDTGGGGSSALRIHSNDKGALGEATSAMFSSSYGGHKPPFALKHPNSTTSIKEDSHNVFSSRDWMPLDHTQTIADDNLMAEYFQKKPAQEAFCSKQMPHEPRRQQHTDWQKGFDEDILPPTQNQTEVAIPNTSSVSNQARTNWRSYYEDILPPGTQPSVRPPRPPVLQKPRKPAQQNPQYDAGDKVRHEGRLLQRATALSGLTEVLKDRIPNQTLAELVYEDRRFSGGGPTLSALSTLAESALTIERGKDSRDRPQESLPPNPPEARPSTLSVSALPHPVSENKQNSTDWTPPYERSILSESPTPYQFSPCLAPIPEPPLVRIRKGWTSLHQELPVSPAPPFSSPALGSLPEPISLEESGGDFKIPAHWKMLPSPALAAMPEPICLYETGGVPKTRTDWKMLYGRSNSISSPAFSALPEPAFVVGLNEGEVDRTDWETIYQEVFPPSSSSSLAPSSCAPALPQQDSTLAQPSAPEVPVADESSQTGLSQDTGASSEKNASGPKRRRRPNYEPTEKVFVEPRDEDVLFGRGGRSNHHPGNKIYHEEKDRIQPRYLSASKEEKTTISQELVDMVHGWGGRFLKLQGGTADQWYEVLDIAARKKVSQALREINTPEQRFQKRARYCK